LEKKWVVPARRGVFPTKGRGKKDGPSTRVPVVTKVNKGREKSILGGEKRKDPGKKKLS